MPWESPLALEGLAGASVLVTGASGFIGGALCRRLRALGARVHAVSRQERRDGGGADTWHRVELADAAVVQTLADAVRPQLIFHLASEVTGSRALGAVAPTLRANLLSTVNLLTAATTCGCRRLVWAGSLEEPQPSAAPPVPCSPYAAAKWASSGYARMFHGLFGTPVVTARLFMVYGPGQRDWRKVIPYSARALLRGESPQLSSGERPVDWIYVDDVVAGLLALGATPRLEGRTLDLGSGELVTVRQVIEQLAEQVPGPGRPVFGAVPAQPMEQVRRADVAATREAVGWSPQVPLRTGLARTVAWCRQQAAQVALAPTG